VSRTRLARSTRDLARLARTLRYLSARQVAARVWLHGRFSIYDRVPAVARFGLGGPGRPVPGALSAVARWNAMKHPDGVSARARRLAAEARTGRFTFLNRSLEFPDGAVDWRPAGVSRLWQYHLHYGDHLPALAMTAADEGTPARVSARALMRAWIAGNPAGSRPGWEPYPLSLRVVNWLAALAADADQADDPVILPSLAAQGRFLARHLERHLGGNHLVKNAKALCFLGAVFAGDEAAGWRRLGASILLHEVAHQVLPDGGHVERSPLYHAVVLEDLLDCLALDAALAAPVLDKEGQAAVADAARRMGSWLHAMRHPGGGLPLFNDCVRAGDPTPSALLAYAGRVVGSPPEPGGSVVALPDSGYFVLASGAGRLVIDCGPIGPDELPAHAHADTLSYELTSGDHLVVVDSGAAEYAVDDLRRYVRSTEAHNTVVVDGQPQSEVWASHRVGRRARPLGARVERLGDAVRFTGAHDGYAGLGVVHHRHVVGVDGAWIVVDELRGRGRHRFDSFIHLHPSWTASPAGGGAWRLRGDAGELQVSALGPVTGTVETAPYCPDWNVAIPAPALRLSGESALPVIFGYVIGPATMPVAPTVVAEEGGVRVGGRLGQRALDVWSPRCTSSS
jgi:uncharacterized heparinase superfamily protein